MALLLYLMQVVVFWIALPIAILGIIRAGIAGAIRATREGNVGRATMAACCILAGIALAYFYLYRVLWPVLYKSSGM